MIARKIGISTPSKKFLVHWTRMRFRECRLKNEGVAGYVEAFWPVLSESQTVHIRQLLFTRCTSFIHTFWIHCTGGFPNYSISPVPSRLIVRVVFQIPQFHPYCLGSLYGRFSKFLHFARTVLAHCTGDFPDSSISPVIDLIRCPFDTTTIIIEITTSI